MRDLSLLVRRTRQAQRPARARPRDPAVPRPGHRAAAAQRRAAPRLVRHRDPLVHRPEAAARVLPALRGRPHRLDRRLQPLGHLRRQRLREPQRAQRQRLPARRRPAPARAARAARRALRAHGHPRAEPALPGLDRTRPRGRVDSVQAVAGLSVRPDPDPARPLTMRRLLVTLLVCAGVGGSALLAAGAGDDSTGAASYWVELDDAFGLVEGADVKVSGVRAGKIAEIDLDASTDAYLARVRIDITKQGFGELRSDVFCESRPQSLIGEYFLDCLPGDADRRLKPGATIPVKQTGTTVPDRPRQQHHAPPVPRAVLDHLQRARRRARRPRGGPQRDDPPRQPGAARDRPRARPARRRAAHDPRPLRRRRADPGAGRRQPPRRRPLLLRGARHPARVRLRGAEHPPPVPAAADVPARAAADAAPAGRGRGPPERRPSPTSTPTPAACARLLDTLGPVRGGVAPGGPHARLGGPRRAQGGAQRAAEHPPAEHRGTAAARGRQEPGDHARASRRPEVRHREGPALAARRRGLHRPRGAAALHLRPVAGAEPGVRGRPSAEGLGVPGQPVRRLHRRRARQGQGPRPLRRRARPGPARHHLARPDRHRAHRRSGERKPRAGRRPPRRPAGSPQAPGASEASRGTRARAAGRRAPLRELEQLLDRLLPGGPLERGPSPRPPNRSSTSSSAP